MTRRLTARPPVDDGEAGGAQTALQAVVDRLGGAFELASAPMAVTTPEGEFVAANAAYCRFTGYSLAQLRRVGADGVAHPDDVAWDRRAAQVVIQCGLEADPAEKRYVRPDGTVVWGLRHATPLCDDHGHPVAVLSQVLDITETHAAREAVEDSERRLRALAEGATDVVMFRFRFTPELVCEHVSRGALAMTGHPPEDHYADPMLLFRLVHPDDAGLLQQGADPDAAREPRTIRLIHPDGSVLWARCHIEPVVEDGAAVGIEGVAHDVTAEEALRARERRFRSLVQNAADLIMVLDTDGVIAFATPSARQLLGYEPEELVGQPIREVVDGEAVARAREAVAGHIGEGAGQVTFELGLTTREGQHRWMEVTATDLQQAPDVAGFVINARDVTERRELAEQLERRANYDELTGVANARRLRDQLAESLARAADDVVPFAVVMLGLDHFETIVETFGYDFGDRVLQEVVARLAAHVDDALLARYEGDQLTVLVLRLDRGLTAAVQRLHAAFQEPLEVDGQPLHIDVTLGVSTFPGHGDEAETLLQRADVARRRAAERGAGHLVYAPAMERTTPEHVTLLGELRRAIDHGELALHYQPKMDLATGAVAGVEALMRWHHPSRGLISPATFVPLAERSGLIRPLTLWAVDAAAHQSYMWSRAGLDLPVAVNITARNLQDASFVEDVAALLQIWGRPPGGLLFELTERTLVTDAPTAARACRRLHELGVGLSVDDFGTGQSALWQLMTLPFNEIKIDKAFADAIDAEPSSRGLVTAMATLGRELGQTVVAEGVEDAVTAGEMRRLGCHLVQGFHVAAPMDAGSLTAWLETRRA